MGRMLLLAACLAALSPAASLPRGPLHETRDAAPARKESSQPVIRYRLRIDSTDLSSFDVEMSVRNAADTFRVAMATHPEYDDRYWRFVEGLHGEGPRGKAGVTRLDSALWLIEAPGGEAVLRYRIRLPAGEQAARAAWRPFLSARGGLTGGVHTFMYLPGAESAPCRVTLELPAGWEALTGLEPTADPGTYRAPNAAALIDSPFLVGHVQTWRFAVDGIRHRIGYFSAGGSAPFDTAGLVAALARLAAEAEKVFGRFPYREYTFLLLEGAYGALEHANSVTVGLSGAEYAKDPRSLYATLAHEFFHTWNLMRLHPAGFGAIAYTAAPRTRGLWWSEGVTMMYADILLRRAGLPVYDSARTAHLEKTIERYSGSPGNSLFSPEVVSLSAFAGPPGGLGDYSASTHVQGEILGTIIDLLIRDATDGRRSMDDLMRTLFERFAGERGFTGENLESAASGVCRCDMHPFFQAHVRGADAIDFNRYLELIGFRMLSTRTPATDADGNPEPDLRVYAWQPPGELFPALGISDPASCWGKAGLHTGDIVTRVNGRSAPSAPDLRALLRRLHTGDTLSLGIRRGGESMDALVTVSGYERPDVRIEELSGATERQRRLRNLWKACTP